MVESSQRVCKILLFVDDDFILEKELIDLRTTKQNLSEVLTKESVLIIQKLVPPKLEESKSSPKTLKKLPDKSHKQHAPEELKSSISPTPMKKDLASML